MKKTMTMLLALAVGSAAAVTLNVTVPAGTPAVYVSGAFNNWSLSTAPELERVDSDRFTIDLPDITLSRMEEGYKYVCGRDWKYVEKSASGAEIPNRTTVTDNDVVGSWASVSDPSVTEHRITVNGYERKVRVRLPAGYGTSERIWPVIYYFGVQQRYEAAGGDNPGDDFFGPQSWNAVNDGAILVSTDIFVAESIPFANPDFMGSGASDSFLDSWIEAVKGFVDSTYRTDMSAASTSIVGADLGGVLSLYAGLTHPELFGRCVGISPLLWLNDERMLALASGHGGSDAPQFILTYGTGEPEWMGGDVEAMGKALGRDAIVLVQPGGTHIDRSWRTILEALQPALSGEAVMPTALPADGSGVSLCPARVAVSSDCSFWYTESGTETAPDNSVSFTPTSAYVGKSGVQREALVLVKPISSGFKGTCYWNVRDNAAGEMLMPSDGKVVFSSKKTAESWLRVAVLDDGSVESCAASSIGFTAVTAAGAVPMEAVSGYNVKTSLDFTGEDKSFAIHYGSVNSQTDMGAVTAVYEVGSDCLSADIGYDFTLNSVTVTETSWGTPIGKVFVENLSAVPSVTNEGGTSRVSVRLNGGYIPVLTLASNYGAGSPLPLVPDGDGSWHADLSGLSAGIHHIMLTATVPGGASEQCGRIAVRVLPGAPACLDPCVTVNAYEGIDWEHTGRYRSNFHTHTSQSFDTQFLLNDVVDRYHKAGYRILALTDHDYNPWPWNHFDLFNPKAESRDAEAMGMLTVPGIELSKDNRNMWEEDNPDGGYFNHHNDFFTGRKGQEFATLRESYAYTGSLGGMQIINHPGQYWSLSETYRPGQKNSPEWHAGNFLTYPSLVGLEVYNQGNRRPNDRILWDQILDLTMPGRPVWGYSGDDTHTLEQYFRNYNIMLMPELTVDALKTAMRGGHEYFSYEFTGSGEAKAPSIHSVSVDAERHTITIDAREADAVYWIYSTDKAPSGPVSSRVSTVVGMGPVFDYTGYQGTYVRALLTNGFGETCTQPFGFGEGSSVGITLVPAGESEVSLGLNPNPASGSVRVTMPADAERLRVYSADGMCVIDIPVTGTVRELDISRLVSGVYVVAASAPSGNVSGRLIVR